MDPSKTVSTVIAVTDKAEMLVRWVGAMTPDALDVMRQNVRVRKMRSVVSEHPDGLAVSMSEMLATANGCRVPVAMVVRPQDMDFSMAFAWEAAKLGVLRGIFTDPLAARQWALRKRLDYLCCQTPGSV